MIQGTHASHSQNSSILTVSPKEGSSLRKKDIDPEDRYTNADFISDRKSIFELYVSWRKSSNSGMQNTG